MMDAPGYVSDKQLKELSIKLDLGYDDDDDQLVMD